MKIYLTKYKDNDIEYAGPNIHAFSLTMAEEIAEVHGLTISGELTDIYPIDIDLKETLAMHEFYHDTDTQHRTIH